MFFRTLYTLSVGPCALEYTKAKTANHFWTDPSADELVQRHRIHSGHCRQDSPTKRPALVRHSAFNALDSVHKITQCSFLKSKMMQLKEKSVYLSICLVWSGFTKSQMQWDLNLLLCRFRRGSRAAVWMTDLLSGLGITLNPFIKTPEPRCSLGRTMSSCSRYVSCEMLHMTIL